VSGIAMIVRSLNIKVIVEGVETTQQAQALMHHHIVIQQGYVHAKPMRPEEVVGQLSKIGAVLKRDRSTYQYCHLDP
jgi:EAL domain-containing protein (putative c-di-GMP-specific phosphodiesterase class I)